MGALSRIREDITSAKLRDPAARGALEIALLYPGLHAVWSYRVAHRLWQGLSGDQSQLGAEVLHQACHHIGRDDHPHQQETEARSRAHIRGDIARIDIGDRGDEGRPEQSPTGFDRAAGVVRYHRPIHTPPRPNPSGP